MSNTRRINYRRISKRLGHSEKCWEGMKHAHAIGVLPEYNVCRCEHRRGYPEPLLLKVN